MKKLIPVFAIIGLLLGWSDWAVARDIIEVDCYLEMPETKPVPVVEIVK